MTTAESRTRRWRKIDGSGTSRGALATLAGLGALTFGATAVGVEATAAAATPAGTAGAAMTGVAALAAVPATTIRAGRCAMGFPSWSTADAAATAAAPEGPGAGAGPPRPDEPARRAMISVSLSARTGSPGAVGAGRPVRRRNRYMPTDPCTILVRRPGWCGALGRAVGAGVAFALAAPPDADAIVAVADAEAAMTGTPAGVFGAAGAPMMIGATTGAAFADAAALAVAELVFAFAGAAVRGPAGPLPEVRSSEAPTTTPTVATAAMRMRRSRLMDPRVVLRYPVRSTDSGC